MLLCSFRGNTPRIYDVYDATYKSVSLNNTHFKMIEQTSYFAMRYESCCLTQPKMCYQEAKYNTKLMIHFR